MPIYGRPALCAASASGPTENPTTPNIYCTPCSTRLFASRSAPLISAMDIPPNHLDDSTLNDVRWRVKSEARKTGARAGMQEAPSDAIDRQGVSVLCLPLKHTWDQGTLPNGPDRAAGLTRNPASSSGREETNGRNHCQPYLFESALCCRPRSDCQSTLSGFRTRRRRGRSATGGRPVPQNVGTTEQ